MSTANNVETLPDPPMVDFGAAIWKYRQAQDGHILVETKAVEKLIRERLTDEVLGTLNNEAFKASVAASRLAEVKNDDSNAAWFKTWRDGIVKAITQEQTKEKDV